ncbi:MAG: hypothetical protein JXA25_07325 [Anaerolineales bacterium]|nr:hypothetical protein [Anaerolineales bacterium]
MTGGLVIIERAYPSSANEDAQDLATLTAALGLLEGKVATVGKTRRKYRSRISRALWRKNQRLLERAGFRIIWSN